MGKTRRSAPAADSARGATALPQDLAAASPSAERSAALCRLLRRRALQSCGLRLQPAPARSPTSS
eukprot:7068302-Alexandrium_andersonii.AAC.1